MDKDRFSEGRPGAYSSSRTPPSPHGSEDDRLKDGAQPKTLPAGERGLMSNFVQQTDNDFNGIDDPSLIGEDIGDDLLDEDGEPIEER